MSIKLPRFDSVVIKAGQSHDFSVNNIGYLLYSMANDKFNIDVVSEEKFLFHAIGTDQPVTFYYPEYGIIRATNNASWDVRFIMLN